MKWSHSSSFFTYESVSLDEQMVVEMMVLLLILWSLMTTKTKSSQLLNQLQNCGRRIVQISGHRYPQHLLQEEKGTLPSHTTFIEGETPVVYLVLRRGDSNSDVNGSYFDEHTLIMAYIHELTHLLSPPGHGEGFYALEKRLILHAYILGFLRSGDELDPNYPCHV